MKTLDEVIKAFEYTYKNDPIAWTYGVDALHYLKEYQEKKEELVTKQANLEEEIDKYCKLEDELNDIRREFIEQMKNNPLTWDELRQMEGKPIWIDSIPIVSRWVIIKKFHPYGGNKNLFDMEVEDGAHFLRKNMKRDDPAWWQAYRKERK